MDGQAANSSGPEEPALIEQGAGGAGDECAGRRLSGPLGEHDRAVLDGRPQGDGATRGGHRRVAGHRDTVAGVGYEEAIAMGWDFETEPEYAAKLAWARAFVDEEVLPLETLDLNFGDLAWVMRRCRRR